MPSNKKCDLSLSVIQRIKLCISLDVFLRVACKCARARLTDSTNVVSSSPIVTFFLACANNGPVARQPEDLNGKGKFKVALGNWKCEPDVLRVLPLRATDEEGDSKRLAPVVQTMDSDIRRINHYPVDKSAKPIALSNVQ